MKLVRPDTRSNEPTYPTLEKELSRQGVSRRGFLAAALLGGAAATTGCMGAPPSPSYPRSRWRQVRVDLATPLRLVGCDGRALQQTYHLMEISSPHADLARRLLPEATASRQRLQGRVQQRLSTAACDHRTLAALRSRVEAVLRQEVRAWYRAETGVSLRPSAVVVRLIPGRRVAR